ncbi:MAG: hypothetical protein GX661_02575 [Acholeplasmataceae bacterium]|nr:hypothetical protein [Acholeplasmataceae bacterium]
MKLIITLAALPLLICASCMTDVDRHTSHVYYVKNRSTSSIRLIGVQVKQDNEVDTVFLEDVGLQDSLLLKIISVGFSGSYSDPLQLDSCDTVFIMKGDAVYNKSANNPKHLQPLDSSSVLFQFDNNEVWVESSRIEYESEGPQPKEIHFEYVVN